MEIKYKIILALELQKIKSENFYGKVQIVNLKF